MSDLDCQKGIRVWGTCSPQQTIERFELGTPRNSVPTLLPRPAKNKNKGTLLGTPNREPQEYSRNIMEYKDPGRYIPIIYLLLGVPCLGFPVEFL